jgi:hypothetical protein
MLFPLQINRETTNGEIPILVVPFHNRETTYDLTGFGREKSLSGNYEQERFPVLVVTIHYREGTIFLGVLPPDKSGNYES